MLTASAGTKCYRWQVHMRHTGLRRTPAAARLVLLLLAASCAATATTTAMATATASLEETPARYQCAETVVDAPQRLEIQIGCNGSIKCHYNNSARDTTGDDELYFEQKFTQRKIRAPSTEITILDANTAVLHIRNASEYKGGYYCKRGPIIVESTSVYVGTPPLNVSDFDCTVYDFLNMTCTFTKPHNEILTTYNVTFTSNMTNPDKEVNCEDKQNSTRVCSIDVNQDYFRTVEEYNFTLIGTNSLGHSSRQHFYINNPRSVIPARVDFETRDITKDSVTLQWLQLRFASYQKEGLEYDIRLRPDDQDWYKADYERCTMERCRVILRKLPYANYRYTVRLRVKVRTARKDERMWSNASELTFRTLPHRPYAPPKTMVGAFYIDSTAIHLFWQSLPAYEHNGAGFSTRIEQLGAHGKVLETKRTKESTVSFPRPRYENYNFSYAITSENDLGLSNESVVIRTFYKADAANMNYRAFTNSVGAIYHNLSYTLMWTPPVDAHLLHNYTIFWCLKQGELSTQCNGKIQFDTLSKERSNYTTLPQNSSLNLAVAANYANYSTGMQWAQCSADFSSNLIELKPELAILNATALTVKWSLDRFCPSILEGYNLTIAKCEDTQTANCAELLRIQLQERGHQPRNHTIVGLTPFTEYRVDMLMFSKSKVGPRSERKYIMTTEAAPTEPRNLTVVPGTVMNDAATIVWLAPVTFNGVLRYYTVQLRHTDPLGRRVPQSFTVNATTSEQHNPVHFNLTQLKGYTLYDVWVTAHTVSASLPSNRITLRTLIGSPSQPREVLALTTENEVKLSWEAPVNPGGRLEFYAIEITTRYKDKETGDEKSEKNVAVTQGNSCNYKAPACIDSTYSFTTRVRAINVATQADTGRYKTMPATGLVNWCAAQFRCEDTQPMNDSLCRAELQYYGSEWETAPLVFCSKPSVWKWDLLLTAVALMIMLVLSFPAALCAYKKYNKMRDIKTVLPEGLAGALANSSGAYDNVIVHAKNTDCLTYPEKPDNCLLPLVGHSSYAHSKLLNSLTRSCGSSKSNSECEARDMQHSDGDSEPSTQSTDSVELRDVSCSDTYITNVPPSAVPVNGGDYHFMVTKEMPSAVGGGGGGGGYVTPAALLACAGGGAVATTLQSAPSGYVTPQAIPLLMAQQTPRPHIVAATAPTKSQFEPQPQSEHSSGMLTHNSNNNNNNDKSLICGYVTQRQLTELGQIALAK